MLGVALILALLYLVSWNYEVRIQVMLYTSYIHLFPKMASTLILILMNS